MNLKVRLAVMNFLEFAVWGAYLTSMGNYLGKAGMGAEISWFYTIQGIVSIFMPTLMGIVADKYIQPQRLLGYCHLLAGAAMIGLFGMGQASQTPNEVMFIAVYTFSVAFYMPTLALSNTSAFSILKSNGLDTVKAFPPIRVFGTVGFILTMWIVNCATWDNGSFSFLLSENAHKFQYTHYQFLVSGVLSILLFLYCFSLPACPIVKKETKSWVATQSVAALRWNTPSTTAISGPMPISTTAPARWWCGAQHRSRKSPHLLRHLKLSPPQRTSTPPYCANCGR